MSRIITHETRWWQRRPVIGAYGHWYNYLLPQRLTLKQNPAIYKWLWWNF